MSSGELLHRPTPGHLLVIQRPMREAAMEDAHEPVGQLAPRNLGRVRARVVGVVVGPSPW